MILSYFELNGLMLLGPVETNMRFKNMDGFESYINAIDIDFDSEDVTFTGYVHKLNKPQFNVVQRSAYAKSTNCMQEIAENRGKNCYIPTSGHCFRKCIEYFTKKDHTKKILTFIRSEKYQPGVMISAKIQPFCRKHNINIFCLDETRINPRNISQRNTSLFIYDNHFCLFWKSQNNSFNQVKKDEPKLNLKLVDIVISDKHAKSFIKHEYKPKKFQSPLNNVIMYHLATLNKVRAVLYFGCLYKLSKVSGKYHQDISEQEYQKRLNDCFVFKRTDCNIEMLAHVLSSKAKPKKNQKNC